jgi:hypothetical protein
LTCGDNFTSLTGFAIDRDGGLTVRDERTGSALAVTATGDLSGLRDLTTPDDAAPSRTGLVLDLLPGHERPQPPRCAAHADRPPPAGRALAALRGSGAGPGEAPAWDAEPPAQQDGGTGTGQITACPALRDGCLRRGTASRGLPSVVVGEGGLVLVL